MNGVIFDFDGVLADSEGISARAWVDVLASHGIEATDADLAACLGLSSRDTYAYFDDKRSLPEYRHVLSEVDERRRACYGTELESFPDATSAARALAMVGVPLAIASSSSRVNLDLKLDALDLGRYFDVTLAGDEVAHPKPEPDLYRAAVAQLGIDAATSIAIEDTRVGADAAAAAGLRTVIVNRMGLPTGSHPVISEVDADMLLLWLGRL